MAVKHKVLVVSVFAGLLLWVADAVVDSLFFYDASFLDMLILAAPPHEIYVRSVGFAIILALGFILAVQLARHEKVERAVRKSRGFLQTVMDAIPAATMVIGRDYKVALANRAARDIAGGKDPATSGLTCHQASHNCDSPCSGEEHQCPLKEVIATKAPMTATHTHHDADGNKVFTEITAAPIFDEAGEVVQIIESCRDITERKRAEEEAIRQAAVLQAINDVFREALTCQTEEELGKACLAVAVVEALRTKRAEEGLQQLRSQALGLYAVRRGSSGAGPVLAAAERAAAEYRMR